MTENEILSRLSLETEQLRRFGVRKLALFGSVARGEGRPTSDLDFLVEFERKTFRNYFGLLRFLERTFDRRVDLVLREALKPALCDSVLGEALEVPGL